MVLIGVSWMMEIISFPLGGLEYIWIPTDIVNIVTGVFVIIFRRLIQQKWLDGLDQQLPINQEETSI